MWSIAAPQPVQSYVTGFCQDLQVGRPLRRHQVTVKVEGHHALRPTQILLGKIGRYRFGSAAWLTWRTGFVLSVHCRRGFCLQKQEESTVGFRNRFEATRPSDGHLPEQGLQPWMS